MGELSAPITILVCSPARPSFGAHSIVRVDASTWRVLPTRYVRTFPDRVETLTPFPCPIGDYLPPGCALSLTDTPPNIDTELAAL